VTPHQSPLIPPGPELEPYAQRWCDLVGVFLSAPMPIVEAERSAALQLIPFDALWPQLCDSREAWRIATWLRVPARAVEARMEAASDAELAACVRAGLWPLRMPPAELLERFVYAAAVRAA